MPPFGRVTALLMAVLVAFAVPTANGPPTLGWRLAQVARKHSFDLWYWEAQTLSDRTWQGTFNPSPADRPDVVRSYASLSAASGRTRAERDQLWAQRSVTGSAPGLMAAEIQLDDQQAELANLRPTVESTVSREIAGELTRRGLPAGHSSVAFGPRLPFLRIDVIPPVFFQIGPLPDLLVVAPVDRVELIGSVLIQPNLTPAQIDGLENRADGLGVSSVVTGIGGLAAYPSMLPDTASTRDLLVTVAHEWTHHYLAFRPLGQSYFNSYAMREINETVADMVGQEVGGAVYNQIYRVDARPATTAPPVPQASRQPARPDFFSEMRQIRLTVDAYLAHHDVAGADAYMRAEQQTLAGQGYYVRRLNTAYLAFFGSYSGTANPYEADLRLLRSREPNLAAFLQDVSTIRQPGDLKRLLAQ